MDCFDQAEFWDRETIERTQLERLRATVAQAMKAPLYAERFAEAGVQRSLIADAMALRAPRCRLCACMAKSACFEV